ncbi:MAG: hypothetical protein ACRDDX_12870 [Cellulosilyticaceae bacterium]
MRYFTTKTEKPATRTTTFNMTEEAMALVKETVRGLKVLGVNITQGEVVNDLITSHGSKGKKIYQIDDKAYSVEELCEVAFLDKADGTVERYIGFTKVRTLVDAFYEELERIEEALYDDVEALTEKELQEEFESQLEENEYEEIDLDNYKNGKRDERLDAIYLKKIEERAEDISEQVRFKIDQLKEDLSLVIYEVPFEYLDKASKKSAEKIECVAEHFLPAKNVYTLMEGLGAYRKYRMGKELSNEHINYILKNKIGTDPSVYKLIDAYVGINKLVEERKIECDVIFFVEMTRAIEKNGLEYSSNGVQLF